MEASGYRGEVKSAKTRTLLRVILPANPNAVAERRSFTDESAEGRGPNQLVRLHAIWIFYSGADWFRPFLILDRINPRRIRLRSAPRRRLDRSS